MSGMNPSDNNTSVRSGRFFQAVTTTDVFVEVQYGSAKGFDREAGNIDIQNTGNNDLDISFDGTNIHGRVKGNSTKAFRNRYESTMFMKSTLSGNAATALVHAW